MSPPPVTLQVSLAPSDYRHAKILLPHQVRVWRGQVAEVLLVIDFHRSAGRFSERWLEGKDRILPLAQSIPSARVLTVDYDPAAQAGVSAEFFGGRRVPSKDFRGGPYYAYFFGLNAAQNDFVLHTDSDILFGGGSPEWLAEATEEMALRPEILFSAPLPGPPAPDGKLHSQTGSVEPGMAFAFRFANMSTRLFLMSRQRFRTEIGGLHPRRPVQLRSIIKAIVEGNPPADLPEHIFTAAMVARGLVRREFLGRAPGMWSLHPPYRCADFYDKLPELVLRVETDDIPDAQRGYHDINASLVNWDEAVAALARNRWWQRMANRART
jgi:hypothetical protein